MTHFNAPKYPPPPMSFIEVYVCTLCEYITSTFEYWFKKKLLGYTNNTVVRNTSNNNDMTC